MALSKRQKRIRIEDQVNPTFVELRQMAYEGRWRDELLYVERVAAEAGIPIEALRPMQELFGRIDADPKPDRPAINVKLFAWADREKPQYPGFEKSRPLTEAHLTALNSILSLGHIKKINATKQQLITAHTQLLSYEASILSCWTMITQQERVLETCEKALEASSRDFSPDISKVLQSGNWCLDEPKRQLSTEYVHFISRPITVPYFNKGSGHETTLPFGQFIVTVYWRENGFSASCFGYKHNLNYRGYVHPHVNASGSICFGNNLSAWNAARAKLDLVRCMEIIFHTLSNFIPGQGSVYAELTYFIALADKARKAGELGGTFVEGEPLEYDPDIDEALDIGAQYRTEPVQPQPTPLNAQEMVTQAIQQYAQRNARDAAAWDGTPYTDTTNG